MNHDYPPGTPLEAVREQVSSNRADRRKTWRATSQKRNLDLSDVKPPHPLKILLSLLRVAAPVDGPDTEDEWNVAHGYLREVKIRNKGTKLELTELGYESCINMLMSVADLALLCHNNHQVKAIHE